MKSEETADEFFDALVKLRGVAELDRRLLRMLCDMQGKQDKLSDSAQKFLCLCFSLWNDGNTRVPLDSKTFLGEKWWHRKWESLKIR